VWQAVDKHGVGASAEEDQSHSAGTIFTPGDMPPEAWLAATAKRLSTVAVSKPDRTTTRTFRRANRLSSRRLEMRHHLQKLSGVRSTGEAQCALVSMSVSPCMVANATSG
jgi:hypothetical protein